MFIERSLPATAVNSGHMATLYSTQIRQIRTSYARRALGDIAERFKKMLGIIQLGKEEFGRFETAEVMKNG